MPREKQELNKDTQSDICQVIEEQVDEIVGSFSEDTKEKILVNNLREILHSFISIYEGDVEGELVSLTETEDTNVMDSLIETYLYEKLTRDLFNGAEVRSV